MEQSKPYFLNVRFLRQILIVADDIMHFVVALVLVVCAAIIMINTLPNFFHPGITGILHILNDVLLALIVMELLWPIVRFLQRKSFSLNPFLYIGIISCTRRILMIEAEHSVMSQVNNHASEWSELWPVLAELGANVTIILVLALALRMIGTHES
jgi:uncharacterized membrane protein (DUF373 family)